jgi:hypothetical protein
MGTKSKGFSTSVVVAVHAASAVRSMPADLQLIIV